MGQKAFYQGKPLRPSLYICGVDVMGGDVKAKIESVDPRHEFWGKTIAIAKCSTADGPKMLRIGAEIEDSLVELFGADVTKWPGHSITLYFVPEVQFKGRRVGGARVRTDNQAPPPRTEPDPKKSDMLVPQILTAVAAAGTLDTLTGVSEGIKKRAGELTKTDIKIVRDAYKARQDALAAPPADPGDVEGPTDPITGDPEGMDPKTGEVKDGPPIRDNLDGANAGALRGECAGEHDDGIPDFGGPE
jgi:hypothetical protein